MKTVFPWCAFFVVVLGACLIFDSTPSFARKQRIEIVQTPANSSTPAAAPRGTALPEQILGEWDFESPPGQGWTGVDATVQPGNFTHVDDFSGMAPPYSPLGGTKSLWCGLRSGDCSYTTLPGYGQNWDQRFSSSPLPTIGGNVEVEFLIRYDVEATYDFVRLEYLSISNTWVTAAEFTGVGNTSYLATIPDADIGATVRLRFRLLADASYSDADGLYNSNGAYVIDNLVVRDASGTINSENFEAEAVDAQATLDGKWSSTTISYGLHAGLFDGNAVLQLDPGVTNTTTLWGFFENSPYVYGCGGHPEQLVVPYLKTVDFEAVYFNNEIWSPAIDVTEDSNGFPVTGPISVAFDVYRDLALEGMIFYSVRVRSLVDGCWGLWRGNGLAYHDASKTWTRQTLPLSAFIDEGATQIQVAFVVVDLCPFFCDIFGGGGCHSNGPLFDNVTVSADPGPSTLIVVNTNDSGVGSLRQAIMDANASADYNLIAFDIPGPGPHVITPVLELPPITERVAIDGYTQSGASQNTNGQWQGSNAVIKVVIEGTPGLFIGLHIATVDNCTIRGLAIKKFTAAIAVQSSGNVVEGCFLGTDATGTIVDGNVYGIYSYQGTDNVFGGDTPADCNVVAGSSEAGIVLESTGNRVENNFVGTDASGTVDLGNMHGILAHTSPQTIVNNLVSGNSFGISTGTSGPPGIQIVGNRVGTDVTGMLPLGNQFDGIAVDPYGTAGGSVVVGTSALPNLVAFNGGAGVNVFLYPGPPFTPVEVAYNHIHSNMKGVVVMGGGTSIIATLTANSIHDNLNLGIDLLDDGITPNDALDGDSGPNDLQNFPFVYTVANLPGGGVAIGGVLESTANQSFAIEYFASPGCDPLGYGEGQLYLGRTTGTSDGSGYLAFNLDLPAGIPGGWYVTTTATNLTSGTTSEFSECLSYINTPSGTDIVVVPVDAASGESPVELSFSNVTVAGNTSLVIEPTGPPPPGAFTFGEDPTFYDLSTTAEFNDAIQICIHYDEGSFTGPESDLKVMHYDETLFPPAWVDVTSSIDTNANILCGTSMSLSPFAVAEPDPGSGVDDALPTKFALLPCAPNPFNPTTTIRYDVAEEGVKVSIVIFDVTGRRVRTLVDGVQPAGRQSAVWDGRDDGGRTVASGVYFYRMNAGRFVQTRKMVLLK